MVQFSFQIGGRTVSPDDVSAALADALEVAVVQKLAQHYEQQLGQVRCSVHQQSPLVFVSGPSLDELTLTIRGCCQDLTGVAQAAMGNEVSAKVRTVEDTMVEPKVFISHASEDKDRFVLPFATKLRNKGVDAWVDRWEMQPGDRLLKKIFDEGLGNAQAVIVVLSRHSIIKPWVREEIDAAFVKRVETDSKLIPVIIDDCEVPLLLKSTVWVKISDVLSYDAEFERIVMAIFGLTDKPALGRSPKYTTTVLDTIPGLSAIDSLVIKVLGEEKQANQYAILAPADIHKHLADSDISESAVSESLQVLGNHRYVELGLAFNGTPHGINHVQLTHYGFEQYLKTYHSDYSDTVKAAGLTLLNTDIRDYGPLAQAVGKSSAVVEHIVDSMAQRGLVKVSKYHGGGVVWQVNPELRRTLA